MSVTYIAEPQDSRCQWWSKRIPAGFFRNEIDLDDKQSLSRLPFLKNGADLELDPGEWIIDSEANHHRKMRGYRVCIGLVSTDKIMFRYPGIFVKSQIKLVATPDQWEWLKKGSGDVAACLRLAAAWENFNSKQKKVICQIDADKVSDWSNCINATRYQILKEAKNAA